MACEVTKHTVMKTESDVAEWDNTAPAEGFPTLVTNEIARAELLKTQHMHQL